MVLAPRPARICNVPSSPCSPAYFLDYEDIEEVRVRKKKFLVNGYDLGVTMANDPPRAAEVFAELLEQIRDELRRR